MKDRAAKVFALLGNPVAHSLSPLMHTAAYREMELEAVYVPFCVQDLHAAIRGIRGLGILGASVTLPFKTEVMAHLDRVEESASRIGAVNTILNRDGELIGLNTDWLGFVRGLQEFMEIRGKRFLILGAGGAARAAAYGLLQAGGAPILASRTPERDKLVARELGCDALPLAQVGEAAVDCLINTTPVGMAPHVHGTPLPQSLLPRFRWVMDVVYNPLRTRLLQEAEQAGCVPIDGAAMFVHQGAEQIRAWTGMDPPVQSMREAVMGELGGEP